MLHHRSLGQRLAAAVAAGLAAPACLAGSADVYTLVHSGHIIYDADLDGFVDGDFSSGGSFSISVSIDPDAVDQDPSPSRSVYAATVNSATFTLPADLGGAVIEIPAGTGVTVRFFVSTSYGVVVSLDVEGGSFLSGPVLNELAFPSPERPSQDIYLTSDIDPTGTYWTNFSPPPTTNGYEWVTQTTDATFYTPMREHDILVTSAYATPCEVWRIRMTPDSELESAVVYHRSNADVQRLAWDPCRETILLASAGETVFVDGPGVERRVSGFAPPGQNVEVFSASMHGQIYYAGGHELRYLDENDQPHPLLDLAGDQVLYPTSSSPFRMFLHDKSNALYLWQNVWSAPGIDQNFIHRLRLNGDGTRVIATEVVDISQQPTNLESVQHFSDGPGDSVFFSYSGNASGVWPRARLLQTNTAPMITTDWASTGYWAFGHTQYFKGVYHPGLDKAVMYQQESAFPAGFRVFNEGDVIAGSSSDLYDPGQPLTIDGLPTDLGFMTIVKRACSCINDVNADGIFNVDDIAQWAEWFLAGDLSADLDGTNLLNVDDIGVFVELALSGCPFAPAD